MQLGVILLDQASVHLEKCLIFQRNDADNDDFFPLHTFTGLLPCG